MPKLKRRSQSFIYFLLLLFFWQTPALSFLYLGFEAENTSYAQNLSNPSIGEASVDETPSAAITLEQWQALQVTSSEALLKDPAVIGYFEEDFNIDGAYGELISGEIVSHWEGIAKTMGTSGLALAGAYSVWRRRRKDSLAKLRAGDANAIETLFEEHFSTEDAESNENQTSTGESSDLRSTTPLPSHLPPNNTAAWQAWGENQGLPATGATLAALYALWIKRRASEKTSTDKWSDYFRRFFTAEESPNYGEFSTNVSQAVNSELNHAKAKALEKFESLNPSPIAPVKTQNIKAYEALNVHYMNLTLPYNEAVNAANAIRYDNNGKIAAIKIGIQKMWQQYYYYLETSNSDGMQVARRHVNDLITFSNRYATSRQKWEISMIKDSAKLQFDRMKAEFDNQAGAQAEYQNQLAAYNQSQTEAINQVNAQYSGWTQNLYNWWNQATQTAQDDQAWLLNLGQLGTQTDQALQAQKEAQNETFKNQLLQLNQVYSAAEIESLLKGESLPNSVETIPDRLQAESQLAFYKSELQNNQTWADFRDSYFHAQGYGGDYRTGYFKYEYNEKYQRWQNNYVSYLDEQPAKKAFEHYYHQQIYATQQQIDLINAKILRQQIESLSGETWLSEISNFDSKTSLDKIFPEPQKTPEHTNLENEFKTLTTEKENAYQALIDREAYIKQFYAAQNTDAAFFAMLNRIGKPYSAEAKTTYFQNIQASIAYDKRLSDQRMADHEYKYKDLNLLEENLMPFQKAYQEKLNAHQEEKENYQTIKDKIPSLNRLNSFIQILKNHPTDSRVQVALKSWQELQAAQAKLKTAQDQLNLRLNTWAQTQSLHHSIADLQKTIDAQTSTLLNFQQSFMATSLSTKTSLLNSRASSNVTENKLESNPVHHFITQQKLAREFFVKYGEDISVISELKQNLEQELENLAYLEDGSLYEDGVIYEDYVALKEDYKKLLDNKLPDVWVKDWSWIQTNYRTKRRTPVPNRNDDLLHDWYHKAATVFNRESQESYRQQIKEREAMLFEQRALVFEANQNIEVENLFTTDQITEYQALARQQIDQNQQLSALSEAETIATQVKSQAIQENNRASVQAPPSTRTLAVQTLKKEDVMSVALSSSEVEGFSLTQIPNHFLEPLWQAFRRYSQSFQFNQFKSEVLRLTAQAQEQYKRSLIADYGLAPAPVRTKTVIDYSEHANEANAEIDKQIAEVEAGIPSLKEKFAGQAYLTTALAQAEAKIEALERYKVNGQIEADSYHADLAKWEQSNAVMLAEIETAAQNHFSDINHFIQGFWDKSDEVVAQKAAEIEAENIIDTRDTVELIDQTPGGFSTENFTAEAELKEFLNSLSGKYDEVDTEPSFKLTNETLSNQAKIYQSYESQFLRSQGLTWDKFSNERIQKLHPEIREKTIELINRVQDEMGVNLRVNIDGNYRSNEDQLKLYCNDKDTGICEGVAKWDDSGNWKSNAKPGESYHNYGLAIDFTEIDNKGLVNNKTDWLKLANIAKELGFRHPLPVNDKAHFVMDFGYTTKELKERIEKNQIKDGYVELFKTVEVKKINREKIEVLSYNFTGNGISQSEAEQVLGFSEDYFQVWAQYQNHVELEASLRERYIKDHMEQEPKFRIEDYKLYWRNITGISNSAKTEVIKVYNSIIKFSQNGLSGEIKSALNYIEKLREYEKGKNLDYKMVSHFALDAYGEDQEIALWGFEKVNNTQARFGIDPAELNNSETGFKASIYENDDTLVVAFAGTEDLKDWIENAKQAIGWNSKQYEAAFKIANRINQQKSKKIVFTGHSLGGGLAAVAAAKTKHQAITFNSAGVHPYTLIKEGIDFSAAEYISSFGGLSTTLLKKLLTDKTIDTLEIARKAGYFNIPAEAFSLFRKDFPNITNHVTRGDILTDKQEDLILLPLALGEKVLHGSIVNSVANFDLWYTNPYSLGASTIFGIEHHRTYGN
ncbi:DUF2974 domain-containing protein [bacterium]|nr:DUF2974 domain-containing protein [bacterium]NCQ55701.1 DUF2974 domain-containing protein [Candidatus Parcubacteria bacterium]NCS67650.1 DUF2974 domain-containing protein [Candidatus Peregrinibacteria bacterium]NCS96664.1 DUF2974 domain-containing protein [bacterium]